MAARLDGCLACQGRRQVLVSWATNKAACLNRQTTIHTDGAARADHNVISRVIIAVVSLLTQASSISLRLISLSGCRTAVTLLSAPSEVRIRLKQIRVQTQTARKPFSRTQRGRPWLPISITGPLKGNPRSSRTNNCPVRRQSTLQLLSSMVALLVLPTTMHSGTNSTADSHIILNPIRRHDHSVLPRLPALECHLWTI